MFGLVVNLKTGHFIKTRGGNEVHSLFIVEMKNMNKATK